MTHGGKRKGAGRPRKADSRLLVNFTLSSKTIELLRLLVDAGDRSAFVEAAIMAALNAL
jgi:hypothetical protein